MSSCGDKCNCGPSCSCSSCGGKMYPDLEMATTVTIIEGGHPPKRVSDESAEKSFGAEGGHGCKCNPCKCDPCNC